MDVVLQSTCRARRQARISGGVGGGRGCLVEEEGEALEGEVDEGAGGVGEEAPEVGTHHALPPHAVPLVELLHVGIESEIQDQGADARDGEDGGEIEGVPSSCGRLWHGSRRRRRGRARGRRRRSPRPASGPACPCPPPSPSLPASLPSAWGRLPILPTSRTLCGMRPSAGQLLLIPPWGRRGGSGGQPAERINGRRRGARSGGWGRRESLDGRG